MKSIHDPRYRDLIQQLVDARVASGITQTVLAEALGKPQSFIAKVENLDRRLDIVEMGDWLLALSQPADEFLARTGWPRKLHG
ncbi:helix-turn-helix domain-containing protein [Silvimonas soli]|uniref:helix-turn-helix domain-containing protein n=1 Tax=Silvimonas soli TaxID=2980100 RepID=UPI0024B33CC6|nr:helix-turn-helix transcriptional regulator [Silvimonas soli]